MEIPSSDSAVSSSTTAATTSRLGPAGPASSVPRPRTAGDIFASSAHDEGARALRLQNNRGTDQSARAREKHTHASNDAVREVEIRCPFPGPIEDQQLLLAERRGRGRDDPTSRVFTAATVVGLPLMVTYGIHEPLS